MRGGVGAERGVRWLVPAAAVALVLLAAAAVIAAVRLGAAAASGGDNLLAELRARTERRVAVERDQIRTVLAAGELGERAAALREAEALLVRLGGNSQLHLLLAGVYREGGEAARALREYRRAVELVRDYAERRSTLYIGPGLREWLREVRPALSGAALGDLHYLERALAGGCS